MKIYFIIVIILLIQLTQPSAIQAQSYVTVNKIELNQAPSPPSSYIVNTYGKLLPPFQFKPTAGVPSFFLRANPGASVDPSPGKNYVRVETLLATAITEQQAIQLPADKKMTTFEYFDGVGRSIQKVNVRNSPTLKDLVSYTRFDQFGRQPIQNLPYTFSGNGAFRTNAGDQEQRSFYSIPAFGVTSDGNPFGLNDFTTAITKSYGPGKDWHDNQKFTEAYSRVNVVDEVLKMTYTGTGLPTISLSTKYPAGSLTVSHSTDEQNLIKKQYTNFKGQVVLDRSGDGTLWHDTYYIYDSYGNLSFVLPPEAIFQLSQYATEQQQFLDKWAFQYKYDELGRLDAKRIPGYTPTTTSDPLVGWYTMIYDSWDRIVLTQDPNQYTNNQWTYTKYDIHNRPIMTGLTTGAKATLKTNAKNAFFHDEERSNADGIGYTNRSFPSHSEANLLTITYYDDYAFRGYPGWDAENLNYDAFTEPGIVDPSQIFTHSSLVKGYATGSKIKIPNQSPIKWLNTTTYYDKKYNVVQTIAENQLGGQDKVSSYYDEFSGAKKVSKRTHTTSGNTLTVLEEYEYDHAHRLLTVKHQINAQPKVLMVSNKYNELGQLIEKNVHSTDNGVNFLQSVDTRYNIRGWVTTINNSTLTYDATLNDDATDLFGMELMYNQEATVNGGPLESNLDKTTSKMYDGNISAIRWKTDTKTATTPVEKIYGFKYDGFKRFNTAYYATKNASAWNGDAGRYNERVNFYDKNGNIGGTTSVALARYGLSNGATTNIDNLSYRYDGNQLRNVLDATSNAMGFKDKPGLPYTTNEFQYDKNGNLTEDMNKSITSVIYNYLDRPQEITISGTDKIKYTYDALGNKLSKEIEKGGQSVWKTDYIGSVQYDKAGSGSAKLSFISTGEGRAVNNGSGYDYEYFLKDHQNNVRVVFGSLKETVSYKATMEQLSLELKSYEDATFQNVPERVITIGNPSLNYTAPSEKTLVPDRSAKVNANAGYPVGPAKSLRVLNGDVVYMEAYAKYLASTGNSRTIGASILGAAVTSTFAIPPSETVLINGINSNAAASAAFIQAGTSEPKAYLIYLFFDDNKAFQWGGATPVTIDANGKWQKLNRSFTANKDGILLIYVASESDVATADVYFDDFYIVHQKNNNALQVLQSSDYYPYGLSFNEYNADRLQSVGSGNYEPTLRNRYLFQEQELQKDLDLGWYQYKYRMHDPAIGRFGGVDPLAEKYMYNSTYAFSENRLIDGIELEGAEFFNGIGSGFLSSYSYYVGQNSYEWDGGYFTGLMDMFSTGLTNKYAMPFSNVYNASFDKANDNRAYDEKTGIYSTEISGNADMSNVHLYNQWSANYKVAAGATQILGNAIEAESFAIGMASGTGASMIPGRPSLLVSPGIRLGGQSNPGNDIAFGLGKDLFNFAEAKGFQTYRNFSTGFQQDKILSAINNTSNRLHFNLNGFSKYRFSQFNPAEPVSFRNITNWELHTILNSPNALSRTTFYRFSNNVYSPVSNPFGL